MTARRAVRWFATGVALTAAFVAGCCFNDRHATPGHGHGWRTR